VFIAKILIKRGVDINKSNNNGQSPIHSAVQNGSLKAIKFAIDHNKTQRKH